MAWADAQRGEDEARLDHSIVAGIAWFRWATWLWLVAVLVATRADLVHPGWAATGAVVAALWSVVGTVVARTDPERALTPAPIVVELAIGFALLVGDGWVYGEAHGQSLGSAWPIAGVLMAGVAWGWLGGGIAGVALGLGRVVATRVGEGAPASTLGLVSTCVIDGQIGAVAGLVMARLRLAERRISAARAREEVARTLHDGVLQTLAVVQRRSEDPELVDLARDQERELRDYLFGIEHGRGDLLAGLRQVAARFERVHGARAEVSAVDPPRRVERAKVDALCGAVAEALTNAAKHGGAERVVVFVEGPDDVFVSVKDDGCGFDPAEAHEGVGLSRSIRGRLEEVGGRVEVDGRPNRGTEVRLWLPRSSGRGPGAEPKARRPM